VAKPRASNVDDGMGNRPDSLLFNEKTPFLENKPFTELGSARTGCFPVLEEVCKHAIPGIVAIQTLMNLVESSVTGFLADAWEFKNDD
jgi:hypothetical protein